jgi:protein-tyrosine phosphatase
MRPLVIDLTCADDERDVVHHAVQALTEGKLVALPTETVYGLAASALHEGGVARLMDVKGRSAGHPLTLAIRGGDEAHDYCPNLSRVGQRLARRCWPGPLTLVVDASHRDSLAGRLPESVRRVVCPQGTVGLRVPDHGVLLSVLKMLAGPIVLSSANRSGQAAAVTAAEVLAAVGKDVDLVLSDARSKYAQPSTVVQVSGNRVSLLRTGVLTESAIRRYASLIVLLVCTGNTCRSPMAQVLLQKHIADRLTCGIDELERCGVMVLSAGVSAASGSPASAEALEAMQRYGLDLTRHESRPLSDAMVRFADIVLTMTRGHREAIVTQWPEAAARTHLLSRDNRDISDPIGGPVETYLRCAQQIDIELQRWSHHLGLETLPEIAAG